MFPLPLLGEGDQVEDSLREWVTKKYLNFITLDGVKPVGYPNEAVLCCRGGCRRPGLVWLNKQDKADYDSGQKEIVIWGQRVKIKVA